MSDDKTRERNLRVSVKTAGAAQARNAWNAEISDLSETGLYVSTGRPLKVGEEVTMNFELPLASGSHPIELTGEVRHRDKDGFGLRFLRLDEDSRATIRRYIDEQSQAV